MAEYYRFFDGEEGSEPEYTAVELSELINQIKYTGILQATDMEYTGCLEVTAPETGFTVEVADGEAFIQGRYYKNTSTITLTIDAESEGVNRIDIVVLRMSTADNSLIAAVLKGTASIAAIAPTLTQNNAMYEFPLCQIEITGGDTSLLNSDLTDMRTFTVSKFHDQETDNPHNVTTTQIGAATAANLTAHTSNVSNPHSVTTTQIGAATAANLTSHTSNTSNPHSVTTTQIGAATAIALSNHTGNTNNPHSVTASQAGAPTTSAFNSHVTNVNNPHSVTYDQAGVTSNVIVTLINALSAIDLTGADNTLWVYRHSYFKNSVDIMADGGSFNCYGEASFGDDITVNGTADFNRDIFLGETGYGIYLKNADVQFQSNLSSVSFNVKPSFGVGISCDGELTMDAAIAPLTGTSGDHNIGSATRRFGTVYCVTLSESSDRELKRDISEFDASTAYMNLPFLKVYTYKFKKDVEQYEKYLAGELELKDGEEPPTEPIEHIGLIADECPDLISRDKKSIENYGLTSYMFAAMKQMQKEIEALKTEIASLKGVI